jgi:NTE family protein
MEGKMKKIALALGGGAVRGLAHIGVIKVLQKNNIPIDFIVGTSMGAAIGGLVAAGIDIEKIEKFVLETPSYRILEIGIPNRGIFAGNKIFTILDQLFKQNGLNEIQIEDLPIPYQAVSVDLNKGELFVFQTGNLSLAIRATTSMPAIFSPVSYQDKVLVDGGVLNNLPADLARKAGMDIVVAVDVEREYEEREPKSLFEVVYRSYTLMTREVRRTRLRYADIVIRPEVGHIAALDTTKAKECIEAGERAAEKKINELKSLLNDKGGMKHEKFH